MATGTTAARDMATGTTVITIGIGTGIDRKALEPFFDKPSWTEGADDPQRHLGW